MTLEERIDSLHTSSDPIDAEEALRTASQDSGRPKVAKCRLDVEDKCSH